MRVVSLDAFKESLVEELGNKVAFTVPVLGGVPVAESVVVTWIVMAALIALALALTRRLSVDRPGKVQCALEWTVEFLNGFVKTNIGAHWRPFAPWLGTVALYIGLSNLIGIFGLVPPTKDISVTAALALMSMFLIYGAQFRYNGLAGLLWFGLNGVVFLFLAWWAIGFHRHHGDAQAAGAGGAAGGVQPLLRPV